MCFLLCRGRKHLNVLIYSKNILPIMCSLPIYQMDTQNKGLDGDELHMQHLSLVFKCNGCHALSLPLAPLQPCVRQQQEGRGTEQQLSSYHHDP